MASTQLTLLLIGSVAVIALGIILLIYIRRSPKDKEKKRRLAINSTGRLGDAMITEVNQDIVFYEYSVSGVSYTASQDVSQLHEHLPTDPERLIGPVGLKYSTRNPANSIIVCELWSGLRVGQAGGLSN